jgi:hypothetical protein
MPFYNAVIVILMSFFDFSIKKCIQLGSFHYYESSPETYFPKDMKFFSFLI